jgi:hypothetical protein
MVTINRSVRQVVTGADHMSAAEELILHEERQGVVRDFTDLVALTVFENMILHPGKGTRWY